MMARIDAAWLSWPETQTLLAAFPTGTLCFVGGCVRDALLSRPVIDIDAATTETPDMVMRRLKNAGIKSVPTGYAHGTVTAVIGARSFEITTLRRDVETDGRHATVAYTDDWRQDAARRDFTMNALYADAEGNVTDYFGGAEDAKAGRVRFIGEPAERIREDALRILRFFRFSAWYACEIDVKGLRACGALAALLEALSGERIAQEMFRLLKAERAGEFIEIMQQAHILRHIIALPVSVTALKALPGILEKTGQSPDGVLALASLLRTCQGDAPSLAGHIAGRWKLSRAMSRELVTLCRDADKWPIAVLASNDAMLKKTLRALGKNIFTAHCLLQLAEGADEKKGLSILHIAAEWQIPVFPVTGNDLIALGMKPGKEMGEMLKKLAEDWEENEYRENKEELIAKI